MTSVVVLALSVATIVARAGSDDVLVRAATAFREQSSYRTEFSVESKTTTTFGIVMSGTVDQQTKLGRFTMRFTFPTAKPTTCTMITSQDVVYIPVSPANRTKFGGKHWVSSGVAGLLPIQGFGTKGFDPGSFAAIHDLRRTGTETIRGVATTRYRGSLQIDKSQLNNDNPAITRNVPDQIPVDLWISADGLIRKMQDSFVTHTGTLALTTTTRFEYFDFGVPVHITAPPANDVAKGAAANALSACVS